MPAKHMVVAAGVGRSYIGPSGPITALDDVSFTLQAGRVVLLLGQNGAGKSSLIHIACQVIRPTTGSITLGITHGRELGWCSQAQMVDWWATVFGNVYLGPRLGGSTRAEATVRTWEALELVGLKDEAQRLCDQLSGGQLQRVQVARALAGHPRLMFLDEPTVGLDAGTSRALLEDLRQRAADGATVVVASHELDLVERHCDEVLLLDQGRLVGHTSRDEFVRAWSREEITEIAYEGELTAEQLGSLAPFATTILAEQPLRAVVPRGESHQLLQAVAALAPITEFRLESPGLREAFLKYQETRAETEADQ